METTELELQSPEAERALIGAAGFYPDAIAGVLNDLPAADFYDPHRAAVWETCRALTAEHQPLTPATIIKHLTAAKQWTTSVQRVVTTEMTTSAPAAHARAHADAVADLARRRELMRALKRAHGVIATHPGEASDVLAAVRAQFDGIDSDQTDAGGPLGWDQLVDEFEQVHAPGGSRPGIPSPWWELDEVLGGLFGGRVYVFGGRPGQGKALALDTPIPTPAGWTTMGEIRAGDVVLGADGRPTTVTNAWDVRHDRPCYEVEFSDGSVIVADAEHQWLTETRAARKSDYYQRSRAGTRGASPFSRDQRGKRVEAAVVTTEQIAASLRVNADQRLNHSIGTCQALQLPVADLLIPPYTLGVWLGDGTSSTAAYTSADPEMAMYIEAEGLRVVKLAAELRYAIKLPELEFTAPIKPGDCVMCGGPATQSRRCQRCWSERGSFTALLRTVGVLDNKHIPVAYLRASEAQRRALLAGLLDTDGTVSGAGQAQFCVTSERLARGFRELAVSLGYRATWTTKRVRGRSEASSTAYLVSFVTSDDVFRLERKRILHKERRRVTSEARSRQRYIVDVRRVSSVPVRCIEVDNADHLYLAGRSMIPTHNSTAALNVAMHASADSGKQSLVISKEMPSVDVTGRILAAGAQVPLQEINARKLTDTSMARIREYVKRVGRPPITVDARPRTLAGIKTLARAHHHRKGLDVLVVDYLQLVRTDTPSRSREQEVAEVSRQLKELALELDCVVVLPAQLNRESTKRTDQRPTMADLRDSGQIEQDADAIVLLHREKNAEGLPTGQILFIVDKNRHGPTAEVSLRWHGGYGAIG